MAAMSAIGFAQDVERVNEAAFVLAAARVASARAAVRVELAPGGTQRRPTVSKSPTGHPGVFGSTPDAAAPLSSDGSYHSWPDWKLWHAVGLCEQRGTGQYDTDGDGIAWHGSPAGGSASSGYPGGLGLGRAFWDEFHTEAGVAQTNGALASPAEQIEVARVGSQNGTHMNGWSSWTSGCVQKTEASL